jgi:hypothetical protein
MERITQDIFDRLPGLLSACQVRQLTGWSNHELAREVQAGRVQAHEAPVRRGCKRSYRKYLKRSVAAVVGFTT